MDIVQASFQASFDSRVDRLSDGDLDDLRVIFRYFDTDGDGAVAADQACRMFALLGLDVNAAQVQELGEVYLNEFMKIVDSHVTPPPPVASEPVEVADPNPNQTAADVEAAGAAAAIVYEMALQQHKEKVLQDEWRLIDTYRRGYVTKQELQLFLANCQSTLSESDLERFLESYGRGLDENEMLELTKEGFLKFRHEYTSRKMEFSEDDSSSESDTEDGDIVPTLQQSPGSVASPTASSASNNGVDGFSMRKQSRFVELGPSNNSRSSSDHVLSSVHEFAINPDELLESDESDGGTAESNDVTSVS